MPKKIYKLMEIFEKFGLLTDNYRIGDAHALANAIKARLGIEAYPAS